MLIAGLASDSQSWAPVVPALSKRFQVIIFDNRGVGRTQPMDTPIDVSSMADDAISLLRYLAVPHTHILGHSLGGMIALECALRCPERIDRLILAAAAAKPSARDIALMRNWAAMQKAALSPALWFMDVFPWLFSERFFHDPAAVKAALNYALDYPWPQSAEAFEKQVEAITRFDCSASLPSLRMPVLSIHGGQDILFPTARTLPELSAIPGLTKIIIPNAAHSIHLEEPALFIEAVFSFLE